jgi:FkbM family methyltransferase
LDHHPIWNKFSQYAGEIPDGFMVDYLGGKFREEFVPPLAIPSTANNIPSFSEDYFGWIEILESVEAATDKYVMLEFGAGYGQWSIRAFRAARQRGIQDIEICGVEAEPLHAMWYRTSIEDNDIQSHQSVVFECLVSNEDGAAFFYIGNPQMETVREWYGQSKSKHHEEIIETIPITSNGPLPYSNHTEYHGKSLYKFKTGYEAIKVPVIRASKIISRYEKIDLLDMDIQGEEAQVIDEAIEELNSRVKRVHIGTHRPDIEKFIYSRMQEAGWTCKNNFGCRSAENTDFGIINFYDGVQTWINPKLIS